MPYRNRPVSPHLQIYRPQLTSVLSITHRLTGLALALGAPILVLWLLAAASGPESYEQARTLLGSVFGRLLLLGWSAALFYHLCNGVRHLFWDLGYGFELRTTHRSGWIVVIASGVMTLFAWILGYVAKGAS